MGEVLARIAPLTGPGSGVSPGFLKKNRVPVFTLFSRVKQPFLPLVPIPGLYFKSLHIYSVGTYVEYIKYIFIKDI